MKNRNLVALSVVISLLLHILLICFVGYQIKKEKFKMHKLPKQYYIDIVTLPKKQEISKKKEKHKIAANIQKKGIAKKYSKKEAIPLKTIQIPKHQAKESLVKKQKSRPKKSVFLKQKQSKQPKKYIKKTVKKKLPHKIIKITGGLYNQKAVISNKSNKGLLSGSSKEYRYKNTKREATISIGTQSIKYASYMKHIKDKIQNVWVYPEEARMNGQQGQLLILFSIGKNGNLERVSLLHSSGFDSLDRAAIQAIRDASPFPPLPKRLNIDRLNIYATFSYKLGFYYVK